MALYPNNTFQGAGRISAEGRPTGHLAAFLTSLSTELDYVTLAADDTVDDTANANLSGDTPDVNARPRLVLADTSGGTVAVTLPDAATYDKRAITVVRVGASNATIVPAGADTINGAGTVTLTASYQYRTVISLGGEWVVIGSG